MIVEKVIYGDNLAAIGLANGTTAASWRTRHLRIRASLLREALNDTDGVGWLGKYLVLSRPLLLLALLALMDLALSRPPLLLM